MKKHISKGRLEKLDHALVHRLNDAGISRLEIKQLTGLGGSTIAALLQHSTFDEYREYTKSAIERYNERQKNKMMIAPYKSEPQESENIITPALGDILNELKQMNKLLTELINSKTQNSKGWWTK